MIAGTQSQRDYDLSVFIGRFQPFHKGHLHNVQEALAVADRLVLIIGSSWRARSPKNPFSFEERAAMIRSDLSAGGVDNQRVLICPVADYFYEEHQWVDDVSRAVAGCAGSHERVAIVGHDKDHSSYYLRIFPNWEYVPVENYGQLHATELRNALWQGDFARLSSALVNNSQAHGTREFLREFMRTALYEELVETWQYIVNYKQAWAAAPFPPVFVTVDALVHYRGEILLIQRLAQPGKGLWALPGGFLDQKERIRSGVGRELVEETCIGCDKAVLYQHLQGIEVFDHPERSERGRTITHVGVFELSALPEKPSVSGADDARYAQWMAISSWRAMPTRMLEDHYQIIRLLLKQYCSGAEAFEASMQ